MSFIGMIIIGFFVGLVARAILPGNNKMGFWLTSGLWVLGSVVVHHRRACGLCGFGIWCGADYGGAWRRAPLVCFYFLRQPENAVWRFSGCFFAAIFNPLCLKSLKHPIFHDFLQLLGKRIKPFPFCWFDWA